MKKLFVFLVKAYQKHISPYKASSCRFSPTCSQYAIEALETRGALVGFMLTVYRIMRCNPFCKGGYDPVPEKKRSQNKKVNKS